MFSAGESPNPNGAYPTVVHIQVNTCNNRKIGTSRSTSIIHARKNIQSASMFGAIACRLFLLGSDCVIPARPNCYPYMQLDSHQLPDCPSMEQSHGVNTAFEESRHLRHDPSTPHKHFEPHSKTMGTLRSTKKKRQPRWNR